MSLSLPLVIKIMNVVDKAEERHRQLDVKAEARRLLLEHPEADKTAQEIGAILHQDQAIARTHFDGARSLGRRS